MRYYTYDENGTRHETPYDCFGVAEAREWFITCGVYMAIDPQEVE